MFFFSFDSFIHLSNLKKTIPDVSKNISNVILDSVKLKNKTKLRKKIKINKIKKKRKKEKLRRKERKEKVDEVRVRSSC